MRSLLGIICLFASFELLSGQNLSNSQLELRNEIKTFLQEEGFIPSIDSDGDIVFKSEGSQYWVSVSSEDSVPMYVSLNIGFNYPQNYSLYIVKLAAADLNFCKGAKILCYEDNLTVVSELFVMDSEQFKYSFYKMLDQVKTTAGFIIDACEEYKGISITDRRATNSQQIVTTTSSTPSRSVSTKEFTIKPGETVQLSIPGHIITRCESDNSDIVYAQNDGVISGVKPGVTNVWAYVGAELNHFRITVSPPEVDPRYLTSSGRTGTVAGFVRTTDRKSKIAQVKVTVKGTPIAVLTNSDGHYSINAKVGDTLVFSRDSYYSIEATVGNNMTVDVTMQKRLY